MSGNIPNILVILLAVATYGSLAYLVMRFALRDTRPEMGPVRRRPSAIPVRSMEPVDSVLAALQRDTSRDAARERQQVMASRAGAPPAHGGV